MRVAQVINQLSLKLFKKRFAYRHGHFISKGYARHFNKILKNKNYDFIIAPAASCEIAHIQTSIPIVYITDGTFDSCLNYHKALSNLMAFSSKQGHQIEQNAIDKSNLVIVSSEWCAKSVKERYHKKEVFTLPFGANFDDLPKTNELHFDTPKVWKLLFVGVYWDNKGGDFAFNCFKYLTDKNFHVELTIVGCTPPSHIQDKNLKVIPFIDKNSAAGQTQLKEIYNTHHVLILPTRFDCTPIVINEASAFGMPSLVANSGGVAGHLHHGVNGYLIDYNDEGEGYAKRIEQFITEPNLYLELRKSTRKLYEEQLNWEVWIKKVSEYLVIPNTDIK